MLRTTVTTVRPDLDAVATIGTVFKAVAVATRATRPLPEYLRDRDALSMVAAGKRLLATGARAPDGSILTVADLRSARARALLELAYVASGATAPEARATMDDLAVSKRGTPGARNLAVFFCSWERIREVAGRALVERTRAGLVGAPAHLVPTLLVREGRMRVFAVDYDLVDLSPAPARELVRPKRRER